jgi:hypothetical protein
MTDISGELERIYYTEDRSITIVKPVLLSISSNGNHRVLDASGVIYVIDSQWIYIKISLRASHDPKTFFKEIYR